MIKQKFKDKIRVLHITTELTPLAKAGGLGDIVGYLPKVLAAEFPMEERIVMARYTDIDQEKYPQERIIKDIKVLLPDNKHYVKVSVWKSFLPGTFIPVYLIECPDFYNQNGKLFLHNIGSIHDNIDNFLYIFISKVAMQLIKIFDWHPDVIHYHDGFEAFTSKWIKTIYKKDPFYRDIATVCTIHNIATQPKTPVAEAKKFGLKKSDFNKVSKILKKKEINYLAEAIDNADMVNTVSPTYAREVMTKKYSYGLGKLMRQVKKKFTGIINGIDYSDFDPRTNEDTPVKYGATSLDLKVQNKLYLQKKLGLTQSPDLPLICVVSRLVSQKGLDLVDEVMKDLVDMGAQFVILGSGPDKIEKMFTKAEKENPKEIAAELQFDANFAQTIYAGADMMLMPSRFEPCGLSQIIAMRFGTIPIVRRTGGLADTVKHNKTGFVFNHYNKEDFLRAIRQAVDLYYNDKKRWRRIQVRCMKKDFSWKKSAKKYMWLYNKAIRNHRAYLEKEDKNGGNN